MTTMTNKTNKALPTYDAVKYLLRKADDYIKLAKTSCSAEVGIRAVDLATKYITRAELIKGTYKRSYEQAIRDNRE